MQLDGTYSSYYEILNWQDNVVWGYADGGGDEGTFQFKADGTVIGTDAGGIGIYTFIFNHTDTSGTMLASCGPYENPTDYQVNGQEATKEQFDAVMAAQNAKPDVTWYDFTPDNIVTALAG